MSPEELGEAIALGREQAGVEFKPPCLRSEKAKAPFARIVRGLIAMANRRDGGRLVIGIEEKEGKLNAVGLTAEQLETWTTHDHVADALATYCDPPLEFDVLAVKLKELSFVVIRVREFRDRPIICKKAYSPGNDGPILREGALYVRPRRKPESVEVGTAADMQDLLELAVQKRLRHLIADVQRAGGAITAVEPPRPRPDLDFAAQLTDLP
jgi:predicted HTH transcriptional regulator